MFNLDLNKFDIKKLTIENQLITKGEMELSVSHEYSVDVNKEKNGCIGTLHIVINSNSEGEKGKLVIELLMQGYFSSTQSLDDKKLAGQISHGKLFPHAQSLIRTATCLVGLMPIIIPEPILP